MFLRRLVLIIGVLIVSVMSTSAQADGQFCVRSFEDRNGNGVRDGGEPLLQRSVSAHLLNQSNVVIATALLDNAPDQMRVNGVICFQGLETGQYTIEVTSAEYRATTPNTLTATVTTGSVPSVLEFGAQSVTAPVIANVTTITEPDPETAVTRIAVAALAAGVALIFMVLVGLMIYMIAYRGKTVTAPETASDLRYRRPVEDQTPPRG